MIPNFECFLEKGEVKRIYIRDKNLAKSLLETAKERLEAAEELKVPKFKLEFTYEAIIELIETILVLDKYNSYSHLANIFYLRKFGFSVGIIIKLDNLRIKRHKSKYFRKALKFAKDLLKRYIRL